jgi:carboxymethylenebutenolidase
MRKRSTAIGTWAACGLVCLAALAAPARADEVTEGEATFRVNDRPVRVERFAPKAGKHPALIVLPGVDGADGDEGKPYRERARLLARRGYVVLLVHYQDGTDACADELADVRERFRGLFQNGATLRPEDQRTLTKHFDRWTAVARAAVRYAADAEDIDRERVALLGVSMGGAVALSAAAREGGLVAAVVNLFGALPKDRCEAITSLPPVLSLHGDLDERVPPRVAYELEKALRAKKVALDFTMYQRVGHAGDDAGPLQLLDMATRGEKFLDKYLKVPHQSPSEHRQIPLDLPRRHLAVVLVPLLPLQMQELRVDRPEPRLDDLVALQLVQRLVEALRQRADAALVVLAEVLASPKLEMGAGIRPVHAAKTSLKWPLACTLVNLDP